MVKESPKGRLGESHPHLALQALNWEPNEYSAGSDALKAWKCALGHEWQARISDRAMGSGKCPYCVGKRVLAGFNDLATINPSMAEQAYGWDPRTVTVSSNKLLEWQCSFGHKWNAKPSDRTSSGSNDCPICTGRRILAGFNDLRTTHPDLSKEAFEWDPSTLQAGSRKNVLWKCSNGHEWTARVSSRAIQGSGCRKCGKTSFEKKKSTDKKKNLLPTVKASFPELAEEAFGWNPDEVTIGSNTKKSWKCKEGHIWEAVVNSRVKGRGCPICGGKRVESGFNDLASANPNLAREAHGWDPRVFTINSNKSLPWICSKGHIWEAKISSRTKGKGCPICAGNMVLVGFNDLQTTNPEIALEAFGWDSTSVTAGTEKKRKWVCPEGHVYLSAVKDRTQGHGCPSCAKTGFDQLKDGWFYLLSHPTWGLMQLGITNVPKKRIAKHKKLGWEVLDIAGPMNGLATRELETKSLRYLKKIGAQVDVEFIAGKFDGYSESWIESKLKVSSISELKDLISNE